MRNLVKIALVANIFESYEFIVYAYLADVIGQLFFNSEDSVSRLIQAFAIFAIGYLAKPLGSLFFGIIGDRVGRGYTLKIVLVTASVSTALIGVLPVYHDVGLLAPGLLLILRLIQGFAMGAELPVTACYVFETASSKAYRSMLSGLVSSSTLLGTLLATLAAFFLFQYFEHETILAWAWRIPFLFSIPLSAFIALCRFSITDLPVHQKTFSFRILSQMVLKTALLVSFLTVFAYTLIIWMPSYLMHFLNYSPHNIRLISMLFLLVSLIVNVLAGYIAQFVTYQRVLKVTILLICILIYPLLRGLQEATFSTVLSVHLLLALLYGGLGGVIMQALAAQFPNFMRCQGMNIAHTFPVAFLGGTAPLINAWMIQKTGWLMFPAFYIMFFGLLALPAAWRLKEVED